MRTHLDIGLATTLLQLVRRSVTTCAFLRDYSSDDLTYRIKGRQTCAQYNKLYCYIVSVKVQFFCLPIGQNRVTCRSTERHVRQPVRNQTFIDRSIIKWVQYACVSTMKFQSSFLKLFTKHLRRSIYPVLISN